MILALRDWAELVVIEEAEGPNRLYFHGSGVTVCCPGPLPRNITPTRKLARVLSSLHGPVTEMVNEEEGSGLCFVVQVEGWPYCFLDLTEAASYAESVGQTVLVTRIGEHP